jgi:hypothetical protein
MVLKNANVAEFATQRPLQISVCNFACDKYMCPAKKRSVHFFLFSPYFGRQRRLNIPFLAFLALFRNL